MTYYEYLQNNEVKLFTVISLPNRKDFFPVVIYRSPYVDSAELLSEDEICAQKAVEYQKSSRSVHWTRRKIYDDRLWRTNLLAK